MTETPASGGLLSVTGLAKSFYGRNTLFIRGKETRALDGVTVRLQPGEILGLVGESGCGKSTFAKVLLGLEEADRGTMIFDGKPIFGPGIATMPPDERGIQMVFQDPFGSLNPRMTLRDLVGEGLRIRGWKNADITAEVRNHLTLVGLSGDELEKYPHQFSGGQRQRICIARAIIMKPKLLIADEAASALDVSVQMQILNLLLDLRDRLGLAIIFISHDMGVIEYLCDRIAVMYRGCIVEQGAAAPVIDRARHPYTAHLIAARPAIGDMAQSAPVITSDAATEFGAGACVYAGRCTRQIARCTEERPALNAAGFACFNPLPSVGG